MDVWTYVIAYDAGAAPNFDPPSTTLTVCKPRIRKSARRGDLVLAFNAKRLNPTEPHSVRWAGVVTEIIPLNNYWKNSRFQGKKPDRSQTPDNIYYQNSRTGELDQAKNTTHGPADRARDISGANALVLKPSWHFGPAVAVLPKTFNLRMIGGRRGHRRFPIDELTFDKLKLWLDKHVPDARSVGKLIAEDIRCSPGRRSRPDTVPWKCS
jgi:hypothetical protein